MDQQIQKMKKFSPTILKGKTRKEIIELLGDKYYLRSDEEVLVYIINKTWFSKGKYFFIEFDKSGKTDTFYTMSNYDFKK